MPNITTLASARRLTVRTAKQAWQWRRSLAPIILLVMIPLAALLVLGGANDQVSSTYGSFASLVMNLAVISAVIRLKAGDARVDLRTAYYEGTQRFVPFVAVLGVLLAQMIPIAVGGLLYVSGTSGATLGLGVGEKLVLIGMWIIIALPSLRWLSRSVFALYLVQDPAMRPIAAVKASSTLVKGRTIRVLLRLLAAALVVIVVLIVPSLAISALPAAADWPIRFATALLQIVSALLLVPFASIYGYELLTELQHEQKPSPKTRR